MSILALWSVREEWLLLMPAVFCGLALAVVRRSRRWGAGGQLAV